MAVSNGAQHGRHVLLVHAPRDDDAPPKDALNPILYREHKVRGIQRHIREILEQRNKEPFRQR